MEFGYTGITFNFRSSTGFQSTDLDGAPQPMIVFNNLNKKIFVTALIFDSEGKKVAGIFDNEWHVFNDSYLWNSSNNAFELLNPKTGEVFFQIEIKLGVVHVLGFLYDSEGYGLYMGARVQPKKEGYFIKLAPGPGLYSTTYIKPLFLYPRWKNKGVRNRL